MNIKLNIKSIAYKTAVLFYFLAMLSSNLIAQDSIVITGNQRIKLADSSAFLFINGSIINESGGIFNSGEIIIKGNVVNNASDSVFARDETGLIRFIGDSIQRIYGNPVRLNKVQINNNDTCLQLGTNLEIKDTIFFTNGIIDLNGNNIHLKNSDLSSYGTLSSESDSSRITGQSGYVYTGDMSFSNYMSRNGVGLGLQIIGAPTGNVNVQRGHTSQITVTDGSIKKYYNVFAGTSGQNVGLEVYYLDSTDFEGINCSEDDFKIFTSHTQGYYFENKYGEVDPVGNFVSETSPVVNLGNDIRITVADHICDNPPIVNIGDTMRICAGSTAYLNAGNTGNYFYWSTGQTSQTIAVTNSGWYYVTVTDPYRCFTVDSIVLIHDSLPHPSFAVLGGIYRCPGEEYTFSNNTNSDPSTQPLTYLWEFGDGSTSTDFEPTKTYLSAGTYNLTLTVTTSSNCHQSFSKSLVVHPLPVVSFNFSNSCDYSPIAFDNTTAAVNTCIWIFGDGTTTNCTNPNIDVSHLYSAYGSYPVTLTVFSSLGCVDSLTQTAHVYPSPVAGFTTEDAQVCQQSASVFHNTSTSLGGTLSYLWDFGNGMSNTTPNPIIYYENSGDFTVTMIANSEYGCSDTMQHMVNISPLPLAAFDFNNTCLEDTIFFENMSSIIGGENLSYEWSFGDGTVSNDVNPAKIYDSEGTYLVILNVISESGCVGYVEHNVHVYPLPSVEFVCQPTCLGNASTFSNYSTTGLGTLTFQWDFGDGTNSTFSNPEHIYLSDGTFQAQLVAVTQYGCSDTMISSVIIHPKPNVEIGDEIYHCYNSYTIDAGNEGCVYHWSNNAASQTITVNTNGYYSVTVTNEFNCTDRDTVNIMLNMPVVVELGGDYQETCDSIVLNAGYPGAQFQWSTGATTQTITVSESGNYLVTVTSQGCTGDTATFIQVYTSPDINLGEDITECEGIDVELSQNLEFDQYSWSTGDTSSSIFVNVENIYALTVTDSHGCYASDEIMVYFNSLPITPFGSDTTVCGSVLLDALNSGAEFLWNDNTTSQHIMVSQSGNYSVTITGGNSCIISDDINIIVNPLPELSLGNDTALCLGELITLNAGDGFSSYLWSDLSTLETLTVGISGNYSVEVGNIYNCFSSDTISIVFNSNPNVNLGNNQFLCANQIALLNAGDDGEFFLWGSSNEFVSAEPQVMVADSGMYWVSVTNSFGCSSVDSVLVQYSEMSLTAYFLAASEAKRGDTVRFVDVSYPAPENFFWSFGDGITSVEETPLHVYFVEGIFQVGLMVSNDYCVDTVSKIITISGTNKMFIPEDVEPAPSESLIEIISASLFPNPANNECYYELQLNRQTLVVLDLYDMRGRVLYSEHIDNASYVFKSLEVASLQPGMYFLRMRYSDKSETYKIIKQ